MRYVALLRGINVGGGNSVPMAVLRERFTDLGHSDVRTYVNSGNVIFDAPRAKAVDLARDIELMLATEFDVDSRVLVLPGSKVITIAEALPADWVKDAQWSCDVVYLFPERDSRKTLSMFNPSSEHEEVRYSAGAILTHVHRSRLSRSALYKLIGTDFSASITIRNCNTARKLAAMVNEDASS
jgi:uncharacterized protein (DUF1697 family)